MQRQCGRNEDFPGFVFPIPAGSWDLRHHIPETTIQVFHTGLFFLLLASGCGDSGYSGESDPTGAGDMPVLDRLVTVLDVQRITDI